MISSYASEIKKKYLKNGYFVYKIKNKSFKSIASKTFNYYSDSNKKNFEFAFRNSSGTARHIIDIFRDIKSPAKEIFFHPEMLELIKILNEEKKSAFYTHSKLSYKESFKKTSWYPHQDNGYKKKNQIKKGFAIFVCLEKMDSNNGCLEVYPKSHNLGTLPHFRLLENKKNDDSQLIIKQKIKIKPKKICCDLGDIIIFHNDMIHKSGDSKTLSKRLALIAEVVFSEKIFLDDYGLPPIMIENKINKLIKIKLYFLSFFSILRLYRILKNKFPFITRNIKKFFYVS